MSSPLEMLRGRKPAPDEATVKQVLEFLFKKGQLSESQYLDTRTDITGREMFTALSYYRMLDEYYRCRSARIIGDMLERLLTSSYRLGRKEGVAVLLQPQPEEVTVLKGLENVVKETTQKLRGKE